MVALVVYWLGDMLDGFVARVRGCETRIGATLDILCDRFCAAAFYIGLMWLEPQFTPAVLIYLAEFMVVDCFLSIAFLAWPVRSPNYFFVIDRTLWLWNWSKPGKAVNSSLFAVLLLVDRLGLGRGRDRVGAAGDEDHLAGAAGTDRAAGPGPRRRVTPMASTLIFLAESALRERRGQPLGHRRPRPRCPPRCCSSPWSPSVADASTPEVPCLTT